MLVLSRKPGEKILIGDNVSVTIVRIGPNTVRIGIEAPQNMNIRREELEPVATETQFVDISQDELSGFLGITADDLRGVPLVGDAACQVECDQPLIVL